MVYLRKSLVCQEWHFLLICDSNDRYHTYEACGKDKTATAMDFSELHIE